MNNSLKIFFNLKYVPVMKNLADFMMSPMSSEARKFNSLCIWRNPLLDVLNIDVEGFLNL